MLSKSKLSMDHAVSLLKAAGETTRLRLLALLSHGDLTVSDLIDILGQSQPRISRHLKLLSEAGLLERYQEGAWAYFRASEEGAQAELVRALLAHVSESDPQLLRDLERLEAVRARRAAEAAHYFAANAADWDEIRSLHADDKAVEAAIVDLLGSQPFEALLDLGTGTGRMLELLSPLYGRAVGVDQSREMLAIARANLDKADLKGGGLSRVQVRQGDLLSLPIREEAYDLVTLHQVLHYLEDPARAIRIAARTLKPGGRMLIVDFAPHDLDHLRDKHAHLRLGFASEQVSGWLEAASMEVTATRKLRPEAGKSLIVTIWLAASPAASQC
ncbi:MAG: ArsR family transcriptional regulator [Nitratireductor sp.]|nr:ArsR family transcriptional regulator [Nitratireductor sp.]